MARLREFDEDIALRRALDLFWERGYEATSMSDLVERLGVARAGIYTAFGSKRELFLQALRRYVAERDAVVVATLQRPGSPLRNVHDVLDAYARQVREDPLRRGCLVVNAAVERAEIDPGVAALVEQSWHTIEHAMGAALRRAQDDGEIGPASKPRALARLLVVFMQGLQVLGRADPQPALVRDAVAQAKAALV